MISFFLKKIQSPDSSNDENIQGPSDSVHNSADDFIFVEKKSNDPTPSSNAMYPPMPTAFGGSYPMPLYPPREFESTTVNTTHTAVPYVQDVPFVLAPQLVIKNTSDLTQTQVDGILALLTQQLSVEEKEEYNFALERSIQNECY